MLIQNIKLKKKNGTAAYAQKLLSWKRDVVLCLFVRYSSVVDFDDGKHTKTAFLLVRMHIFFRIARGDGALRSNGKGHSCDN